MDLRYYLSYDYEAIHNEWLINTTGLRLLPLVMTTGLCCRICELEVQKKVLNDLGEEELRSYIIEAPAFFTQSGQFVNASLL